MQEYPMASVSRSRTPREVTAELEHDDDGRPALRVNGTVYAVTVHPAEGDGPDIARMIVLEKLDGTAYAVVEHRDGWSCGCPDWEKRHAPLEGQSLGCKHILGLRSVGLLDPEPTPRDRAEMHRHFVA